jgi:signal transduction histidine kinase
MVSRLDAASRREVIALSFAMLLVVAALDFLTGYEISCTVFYLLSIGLATWFVNASFGILISLLSAISTSAISIASGEHYSNHFAPFWNGAIVLSFYLIVVWLLRSLRMTQDTLEERVRERTASLSLELVERKRLENEVLVISEREQRRIGLDIHDSLCQHLTATALAEQFLVEKLNARGAAELRDASRVVDLIEEAITMARGMAVGLFPIATEGDGLLTALNDLAAHFSSRFNVSCQFTFDEPFHICDPAVTTHLYRIAQEAIHNSIRHGKARNIEIRLTTLGSRVTLAIRDDGSGMPEGAPIHLGMGLRNMKYRASMIGGSIALDRDRSGMILTCSFHQHNGFSNAVPRPT